MSDTETLKIYAAKADEYASLTESAVVSDPNLKAFVQTLARGGHVLDLGCGPGGAAHVMADAGLLVTATDAVPEMVALAGAHPNVTARLATFDDITGTALYDGVWANFSLLHAPRADMPCHLTAIHRALKPGGSFHIGLKTGTGSSRDRLGRLYTYYSDDELSALLAQAGFTITGRTFGRDRGLEGTPADWIVIRAHA